MDDKNINSVKKTFGDTLVVEDAENFMLPLMEFVTEEEYKEGLEKSKKYYEKVKTNKTNYKYSLPYFNKPLYEEIVSFIQAKTYFSGYDNMNEAIKYVAIEDVVGYLYYKSQGALDDYVRYLKAANKFKLDMNSSEILFPKNFTTAYNDINEAHILKVNEDIENKMLNRYNLLKEKIYEEDSYKIYPPKDINELFEEIKWHIDLGYSDIQDYIDGIVDIYIFRDENDLNGESIIILVKKEKIKYVLIGADNIVRTAPSKEDRKKLTKKINEWGKKFNIYFNYNVGY